MNDSTDKHTPEVIEAFIARWQDTGGKERANYQLFLTELCHLPALPGSEPAKKGYAFVRGPNATRCWNSVNAVGPRSSELKHAVHPMALVGEVGELVEEFQWLTEDKSRRLSASRSGIASSSSVCMPK